MDRQAFKQRMQNLKSYRENNPGKGYWDWKVEAFRVVEKQVMKKGNIYTVGIQIEENMRNAICRLC